jgi:hypothetical protein
MIVGNSVITATQEGNRLNRSEGGEVERWRDVFETIHFRLYAYASQCEA